MSVMRKTQVMSREDHLENLPSSLWAISSVCHQEELVPQNSHHPGDGETKCQ
jgi:hypothetical protein